MNSFSCQVAQMASTPEMCSTPPVMNDFTEKETRSLYCSRRDASTKTVMVESIAG